MPARTDSWRKKIGRRSAVVGIIGLGYVGLPLALASSAKEFAVLGFDVDTTSVDLIAGGKRYITRLDSHSHVS